MVTPVLIDTDPGIDDALALIFALRSPELSVKAITTVAGNVSVELTTRNVFRILEQLALQHPPPVARGAEAPLVLPLVSASHIHGEDGLGELHHLQSSVGVSLYPEPTIALSPHDGPELILETLRRWPNELVLIALGPLTNLAVALQRDPTTMRKSREVIVMGGAIAAPGNVTAAAEFNFYVDPEAAHAVLAAGLPIRMVPLDVTCQVLLQSEMIERWMAGRQDRQSRFVRDLTHRGFELARASEGLSGLTLHDPLAVGLAVDPSLVKFEALTVDVETQGQLTRGMSLADRRPLLRSRTAPSNCQVAMSVDAERFLSIFLERLCPESL
jgi:purine nucleosidase/pyrimidine-specific ribonucleoside hydrolase